MDFKNLNLTQQFQEKVALKYQLFNSLLTHLPFHKIERTGVLLSVFNNECEDGYKVNKTPFEILDSFIEKHTNYSSEQEKIDLLFRFIQYIERQVVLFDALEDAAYTHIHPLTGKGTIDQLMKDVMEKNLQQKLQEEIALFETRLVLTAHPTQFYPGTVLAIINDLSKALNNNDVSSINSYLQQLGKTPFFQKQKPTPQDEANSLIWYLENVFYRAAGNVMYKLQKYVPSLTNEQPIKIGFWPGGDRDGNPFVTAEITLRVANALKESILKCYYLEVRKLRRRLTFKNVLPVLVELEDILYQTIFLKNHDRIVDANFIMEKLLLIKHTLIHEHSGLFLNLVEQFIAKVNTFQVHFATLDIRQESSVHGAVIEQLIGQNYTNCLEQEKMKILAEASITNKAAAGITQETIDSIAAIAKIQKSNGEKGCNRYIISQCKASSNVLEVLFLLKYFGFKEKDVSVDIVPLFETVEDLRNAPAIMEQLYKNEWYSQHLASRTKQQTVMLGFSDGTKDGGYLAANYSIYKAKEDLFVVAEKYGYSIQYFDGRGGPPSRGGGKTHQFYASMNSKITNKIQLTIQGQTISSNFGTVAMAQHNMEQLLHAGISNAILNAGKQHTSKEQEKLLEALGEISLKAYLDFKAHPMFLPYLSHITPVKYYSETNIASRPSKRNNSATLAFNELRAIPYVGAWAQIKQNVSGFYGVGIALESFDKEGQLEQIKNLYQDSLFFRTLIDNCEMAMKKCFMPLTMYLSKDEKYGAFWQLIYEEFERTKKYVLLLSGQQHLMAQYPIDRASIALREKIVLPLITIQQYALKKIRDINDSKIAAEQEDNYKKIIMRSSFGIINAGRNAC